MMFILALLVTLAVVSAYDESISLKVASNSTCVCTTVPCPVGGNNYLTEGGGAKGTYYYALHNGHEVVTSASVTITKADLDKGTETTDCTQSYSRTLDDDGVQDCDAGHILAHRLGGPGNQPINIFPQDSSVNRGTYAQYEDKIYDCISVYGATSASLKWSFKYDSTTRTKPSSVTYSATFNGGTCADTTQTFPNQPTK
eukprot:gene31227-37737_t